MGAESPVASSGWEVSSARRLKFKQSFDYFKHLFNIAAMRDHSFFSPALSKSDRARLRLLEAAVRVFGVKGPKAATVREIAKAAGQNVAAIAYYFGDKQGLYLAVVEGIVRELRARLGEVLPEAVKLVRNPRPSRTEAARLVLRLLATIYLQLLSRNDAIPIVQLVVREQLGPTAGFEILYEQGFRDLHELLCALVGAATGTDPLSAETIVLTHTLMGQVYFFAMSREAALRRLGWKSLEGENARLVTRVLEQNLEKLLTHKRKANCEKN